MEKIPVLTVYNRDEMDTLLPDIRLLGKPDKKRSGCISLSCHRHQIYGYSESDNENPARYLVWPQIPDIRLL